MSETITGDTPIHRRTLDELSVDELDSMLDIVRDRRLHAVRRIDEITAVKVAANMEAAYARFDRMHQALKKQITALSEKHEKLEIGLNKLRALRLEIEDMG